MIFIGEYNNLKVDREVEFGFYLVDEQGNDVLLPYNLLEGNEIKEGDTVEVFIYKDSKNRPIATFKKPLITVGEVAYLEVHLELLQIWD